MVIDCVSYNGEKELFDLRYNILKDYVDKFVIVEAPTTFSGNPKPLYFPEILLDYPNVEYHIVDENYSQEELELAFSSPNTEGAEHWKHEFLQKESIKKALESINVQDDDLVFIGDCDEIWDPDIPEESIQGLRKLKLRVYTYYLNNRSDEQFWGTLMGYWKDIKGKCLNHLRTNSPKGGEFEGWHFTSLKDSLRRKLEDSYTKETYANEWVMENLEQNIKTDKDFLGRNFMYRVTEEDWPQYLKDNKEKYINLCK